MGFGPFSSSSEASDSRIGAGDNSNIVRGKGRILEQGALSVADKGQYLATGSIKLEKSAELNTGIKLGEVKGNIVINDVKPLSTLNSQLAATLGKTVETLTTQNAALSNQALSRVSDLSQSAQTGGAASKPVVTIIVAVLALVAVIFFFRR